MTTETIEALDQLKAVLGEWGAVAITLVPRLVADQFTTAFEGGSNYWLGHVEPTPATRAKAVERPWYSCPKVYEGEYTMTLTYDNPEQGPDVVSKIINETHVMRGLQIMADKYMQHFTDLVQENGDATTADVFVQCVLFGELVYG